jgi:hypothetical protein
MSLKIENSRRVAKSRPVWMDLKSGGELQFLNLLISINIMTNTLYWDGKAKKIARF